MPVFFSRPQGTVLRLADTAGREPVPFYIRMSGIRLGSEIAAAAIVTRANVDMRELFHTSYAIGGSGYIYPLGDAHAELTVEGTAFTTLCLPGGAGGAGDGLRYVLDIYETHRVSRRASASPVLLSFGTTPFRAYLVGCSVGTQDTTLQTGAWRMSFRGVRTETRIRI